ncbi:hypothetical protein [Dyella subtropica]|uniref:hypothetical protein n=1 Tax=Dyella subtropica TaxID=2992127 RepID=UPI00225BA5B1|nr:hypothetical protein [Dyella subtropica]
MELKRLYYPAIWFFWGSILVCLPASWLVSPPVGLSTYQLAHFGAILRSFCIAGSFAGFFGYAVSLAVLRAAPRRWMSMSVGAGAGLSIIIASLPKFISMNFGPTCASLLLLGMFLGIPVGLRARGSRQATKVAT